MPTFNIISRRETKTTLNLENVLRIETKLSNESYKASKENQTSSNNLIFKKRAQTTINLDSKIITRDRQKKDNHNMIERRRRFNINDRIKELSALLPTITDPHYEIVRDLRPNKGTILKGSVDYIKCLKREISCLKQNEFILKQIEIQNRDLLIRVKQLEIQARLHGLPLCEVSGTCLQNSTPKSMPSIYANVYLKESLSTKLSVNDSKVDK